MSPRDAMLARIRRDLGGSPATRQAIEAEARALAAEAPASRPALLAEDLVEAFGARLLSPKVVGASLDTIRALDELPAAIRAYCDAQALAPTLALAPDPTLLALDWSGFTLHETASADETMVVARARWAIAETGTFVFHSGPDSPVLLSFLPMHHVCVIEAERILGHLEDYAIAEAGRPPPRNVNFITGASGTSDIEGRLVRGAHGPGYLHAVIVESRGSPPAP